MNNELDKLVHSDIKDQINQVKKRAEKNDKNASDIKLDNLINMMKEFDYKKNGKVLTLEFLATMYNYFIEIDF